MILHADMDAFYASVEQLDHPEYRGKPLVVGQRGPRSVVAAASYEARAFGLHSAMPMAEALRRCPHAIVAPNRMDRYREVSQQVMAVFGDYAPLVEPLSLDEAFLDMSGTAALFGPPEEMGARLKADVRSVTGGLTVSVGIATSKYVAKVASDFRKPDGLTVVPPGTERDFLWPLPISRLWGVGPVLEQKMRARGLLHIADVARCTEPQLTAWFGNMGRQLWQLSCGIDAREVTPPETALSVGREYTLMRDVHTFDEIWPHLRRAADRVSRTLRADALVAGGVRVKLKTRDFHLQTRQAPLQPKADCPKQMLAVARELLTRFAPGQHYRLVGLTAYNLSPRPAQMELFANAPQQKERRLYAALDQVTARFGQQSIRRAADLEDDADPEDGALKNR